MRILVLLLPLAWHAHAAILRNVTGSKPALKMQKKENNAIATPKTKQDKEEHEAIAGLVKGLNSLESAGGKTAQAVRRKAMRRNEVLVAHKSSHTNVTNMATNHQKPEDKKTKEDKEDDEAIGSLVKGLNRLPMRGGQVSKSGAAIAAMKGKKEALVSRNVATPGASPAQEAEKTKEDKEGEKSASAFVNGINKIPMQNGKISANGVRRVLATRKAKAALAVKHQMHESGIPATIATPGAQPASKSEEDKEGEKAASAFVNGLSKIPTKNGKVSPNGVRRVLATQKAKAALAVKNQTHVSPPSPPPHHDAPSTTTTTTTTTTTATTTTAAKKQKHEEDKEGLKAASAFVNGLSKIPMKNGKISPSAVRQVLATRTKNAALIRNLVAQPGADALVAHAAAPHATVNARDAEQAKRIEHALAMADAAEKSVNQFEKEAHEEAEEARKLLKSPSK